MKGFVTGDAQTMTFTVGAGYTRVYIKITQKNCSTSKYFYVDDIIVTLTASPYTSYLNNNFNTPAMTVTNVTSTKRYFDDWTAWDYSENYDDPQNTGDGQLEVMSGSCNHGMQHYIDVPAGQALTLTFDVDLGTSARMNIWVWDVNGSGALSNARAPGYVTADGSYSFTITAPTQSRILIQFRPNECTGVYNFYMDNVRLYYLGDVFTTVPLNTKSNYRFGYNGKEKTNEVYGEGNLYDYGFRIYDPRTCRFLSNDPLFRSFPWYTPYQFAGNTPIWANDLDGLEDNKTNDGASGSGSEPNNNSWRVPMAPIHEYEDHGWGESPYVFLWNVNNTFYNGLAGSVNAAFQYTDDVKKREENSLFATQAVKIDYAFNFFQSVLNAADYNINTPIGKQLADSYGNPHFWEGVTVMVLTDRIASGVGTGKPKLSVNNESNITNTVKKQSSTKDMTAFRVQGGGSKYRFSFENGKLKIVGDDMLFVNFGSKARAYEFALKRGDDTYIVSFKVKDEFYQKIKADAIPQKGASKNPNLPQIVDPTKAANQFGIPKEYFDYFLESIDPSSIRLIKVQ